MLHFELLFRDDVNAYQRIICLNLLPSTVIRSHPGVLIVNVTELDGRARESRQKDGHNESSGEPESHPAAEVLPAVRDY